MLEQSRNFENDQSPDQWVELYGNSMYRYALRRISDTETAQDLVQEALVGAVAAYKSFKRQSSIKTWLIAILKRKIVDYYRKKSRQGNVTDVEMVADAADELFDETGHWRTTPIKWQTNPDDVYEQKEFMDVLYHCLGQLPNRLAEAFMLREFEELETQELCRRMDISESNSWVMLYRARVQLRNCIQVKWL